MLWKESLLTVNKPRTEATTTLTGNHSEVEDRCMDLCGHQGHVMRLMGGHNCIDHPQLYNNLRRHSCFKIKCSLLPAISPSSSYCTLIQSDNKIVHSLLYQCILPIK